MPDISSESLKWLLEHTASTYQAELQNTEKIKDRISFVLTVVLTPLAGISVYLISGLKGDPFSRANAFLFWLPVAGGIACFALASGFLAYALLRGFQYARPPLPSEIARYLERHPEPHNALQDAQLGLLEEFAKSVDHNFEQNQLRVRALLKSQRAAFAGLLLLALSTPRWTYNAVNFVPEPQAVKITSPVDISREKPMSSSIPSVPVPSASQPSSSAAPVPSAPTTPAPTKSAAPAAPVPTSAAPAERVRPPFPTRTMTFDASEDNSSWSNDTSV